MNHELIMAERRSVVPGGEGLFMFVFDPKPGRDQDPRPPHSALLIQSVCERFHVEMMTLKESI